MRLFHKKIIFKSPSQNDIVIFEKAGSERIVKLILPGLSSYILDSNPEEIFISLKIIGIFCLHLRYFDLKGRNNFSKTGRGFLGQLLCIYLLSCLKCFKPKVILTAVDNHGVFHWLCERYKGAEFMAIQNGNRTRDEFRELKVPHRLGHFFCFGDYEKDLYSEFGHKVDQYYPVGSLLSGYYRHVIRRDNRPHYDLCVVSSWRGNIGNGPEVQRTMASMKTMDQFLSRYIKEYGLKASIVLRSSPGSVDRTVPVYGDEKEYFQNIYPAQVDLVDPNFQERNIYPAMDQADVIISSGSTAPREAFGWGKKILYCDFTGTDLHNDYDPMILFKIEDYDLLRARLDEIRNMPHEEYKQKTKNYAAYLMHYDPACPPYTFIRKKIEYYLAASK